MSDWNFLNAHRIKTGIFSNTPEDGWNGAFEFQCHGRPIRAICSDREGWKHVSVSQRGSHKPPPWEVMNTIKDLFWEPEDWVVQFHPAHSAYINNHPGCLHLWQPVDVPFPTPPEILTGIKGLGTLSGSKKDRLLAAKAFLDANKP